METYHKIQSLFKRHMEPGKHKGKMIPGEWTTPELEYLAGNQWEFTEKVDGTNIRIEYIPGADASTPSLVLFGGRSDSADIPGPLLRYLEETFTAERFHQAAFTGSVTLFGEGYGPKIQGGHKYRDDPSFVLFDVKIGSWWLLRKDVDDIASKLGIDAVPTIGNGTLHDAIALVSGDALRSKWGSFTAEGIVARPLVPMFDRKGQRIITKIKTVDFR